MECGKQSERFAIHSSVSQDLIGRWRSVWETSSTSALNSEPERFLEVVRAIGATPFIIELGPADGLPGLVIARKQVLRDWTKVGYFWIPLPKLRSLLVVYGGLLGRIEPEVVSVLNQLCQRREIESIKFNHLQLDCPLTTLIREQGRTVEHIVEPHWELELGASFDETMRRHSGKHRRRLKWEARKLSEAFGSDMSFQTLENASDVDRALTWAARISGRTYHAKVGGVVEISSAWKAQLSTAAQLGNLRAHFLIGRNEPVAFVLGINEGDRLHVLAMAYLPEYGTLSPGKHALLHAIERASLDGLAWVDYGFGDAEYKRLYGTSHTDEISLVWYGVTVRARIAWLVDALGRWADRQARGMLEGGESAWLKRAWRRLLSREPRTNTSAQP